MADEQKKELAQRDKEMRAGMFDSLFARITWLDAAAIAAIAAYLSRRELHECLAEFGKLAVASFAVSLAIQLFVPTRRAWASFDRDTLDTVGWWLQYFATAFAIIGVVFVAVGMYVVNVGDGSESRICAVDLTIPALVLGAIGVLLVGFAAVVVLPVQLGYKKKAEAYRRSLMKTMLIYREYMASKEGIVWGEYPEDADQIIKALTKRTGLDAKTVREMLDELRSEGKI